MEPGPTPEPTRSRQTERRQRVSRIRRGAIGGSIATFAAVWAAIFFQLVTGHDPALSKATTAQPAAAATSSSASDSSSSDDSWWDSSESDSSESDSSGSYGNPDPTTTTAPSAPLGSVTTQQS